MPRGPEVELTNDQKNQAATICRAYRKYHGLTQMQLAVHLDTTPTIISLIENAASAPSSRVIAAILELTVPSIKQPI